MDASAEAGRDLQFIKAVVERRRSRSGSIPGIYLVVGVMTLIGWPMVEWCPQYVGTYWMIAGPLCGVVCWMLGKRASLASGEYDRRRVRRIWLHWLGFGVGYGFALLLAARGVIKDDTVGQVILLTLILSYYTAAIHYDVRLIWPCAVMTAGLIASVFYPWHLWTVMGVLFFLSMAMNAYFASREDERTSGQA